MKGYKKTGKVKSRRLEIEKIYSEIEKIKSLKKRVEVICKTFPESYPNILRSRRFRYLYNLIIQKTPLLDDPFYTLATRIHWFLNGWKNFPRCLNKECGHKRLKYKNIDVLFGHYPRFCSQTCINQSQLHKDHIKETSIKHFGTEHPMQSEKLKEKKAKTLLERTGFDNPMKNPETVKKGRATYKARTGYEHLFYNPEFKKRRKITWMKNYGVDSPSKSPIVQEKIKATSREKYHTDYPLQSNEIRKYTRKIYRYDDNNFASLPELCFYIWLQEKNVQFVFQPNAGFTYEFRGKTHVYTPDFFLVRRRQYVDIKGVQFFKDKDPAKEMINPFDHTQDELYEAKHQCMLRNNVKIITDYKKYVRFATKLFGIEKLEKFRTKFSV